MRITLSSATDRRIFQAVITALALACSPSAIAQVEDKPSTMSSPSSMRIEGSTVPSGKAGQNAVSTVGIVGQRQTREQATANVQPMARINGRIENRVQNRIRNRIDRDYDLQANARSPYAVAQKRVQTAPGWGH